MAEAMGGGVSNVQAWYHGILCYSYSGNSNVTISRMRPIHFTWKLPNRPFKIYTPPRLKIDNNAVVDL